ncbi:MAG: beta-galactosidase, partial [Prevotella sp.]|nr:beta-galactosidase [Prevotella sp.]
MKHHIIIYTLLLSAALPHPSKAAGDTTAVAPAVREWEDQSVLHVNRRPARSWFMPFVNRRGDSEMSLNGEWEFRWAPTPATVGTARWTTLHVPANWEVNGYGTPIYASAGYTFKVRPPFVMDEPKETFTTYIERNPTGEYRRTFRLPASWHGGHTFLRFDGVMSAFYVSING